MKRCPKCGGKKFIVTQHVAQTVLVDADGNFISEKSSCDEVTHAADDDDIWTCDCCGFSAAGSKFNAEEAAPAETGSTVSVKTPVGTLTAKIDPEESYPGIFIVLTDEDGESASVLMGYDIDADALTCHAWGREDPDGDPIAVINL